MTFGPRMDQNFRLGLLRLAGNGVALVFTWAQVLVCTYLSGIGSLSVFGGSPGSKPGATTQRIFARRLSPWLESGELMDGSNFAANDQIGGQCDVKIVQPPYPHRSILLASVHCLKMQRSLSIPSFRCPHTKLSWTSGREVRFSAQEMSKCRNCSSSLPPQRCCDIG